MKCDKCGEESSTVKEYKWILARELERVYEGRDYAMSQDKYRVTYGEFTPISVNVCSECIRHVRRSKLSQGMISLALAAVCSVIFVVNGLKPGSQVDTMTGIILPAGGVLVFVFVCLVMMHSRREESIASGELHLKGANIGLMDRFDKRFSVGEYEAMVRANKMKQ